MVRHIVATIQKGDAERLLFLFPILPEISSEINKNGERVSQTLKGVRPRAGRTWGKHVITENEQQTLKKHRFGRRIPPEAENCLSSNNESCWTATRRVGDF